MKVNPAKCVFGMESGKFLGFMITCRGIEANPEKIEAIIKMERPRTINDVQKLNGKIIALGRFLSKSVPRSLPFLKTLRWAVSRKDSNSRKLVEWTEECEKAFQELKQYLQSPPLLSRPVDGEALTVYMAVELEALSSVLVRTEEKIQRPVFYVSRILKGSELNYNRIEKAAYTLIITARRLRPYFQSHPIEVLTDLPLQKNLTYFERSGRMVNWGVELSEFEISYKPRPSIKALTLADFVVECIVEESEELSEDTKAPNIRCNEGFWVIYVDGSSSDIG